MKLTEEMLKALPDARVTLVLTAEDLSPKPCLIR